MKTFWSKHKSEVGWLAGVAIVILLGFWWIPGDRNTADDSYSVSTDGKKAFFRATQELLDYPVRRNVDRLLPPADADTLVMIGPARYPDSGEWKKLHDWIQEGHTLVFAARFDDPAVRPIPEMGFEIVALQFDPEDDGATIPLGGGKAKTKAKSTTSTKSDPKLQAEKDPDDEDSDDEGADPEDDEEAAEPVDMISDDANPFDSARIAETELVTGSTYWSSQSRIVSGGYGTTPLVTTADDHVGAIVREIGAGYLVVCSSDHVFTNRTLMESEHRELAWRIFEQGQTTGPVYFDEYMNESGTPRMFGIIFHPRIRPFTLQLLLVTILFGWWGSRRFGPVQEHEDATRRDVREHAAALGQMHYKVKGGQRSVKFAYDRFKSDMRLTTIAEQSHAAVVAARSGLEEHEVADLINRIRFAEDFHGKLPNSEAAGLIIQLAELRNRIRKRTAEQSKKK